MGHFGGSTRRDHSRAGKGPKDVMQSRSDDVFTRHLRLGVAAALALGCVGALAYEAVANQAPDTFDAALGVVAMASLRVLDFDDIDIGGILGGGKKSA